MREDAIGPTTTAWSTNPTAFVMCDGAVLYKWDLGDFDKLPKQKMPPNSPEPFKKNCAIAGVMLVSFFDLQHGNGSP